ncbi:IPExxxVDY family protein [Pontibacter silvestris]|uniref:IPExxxVDY family protein n=1 Tax=Pontibacter silvestris TaxID=2305183 RepID=A0ABW4WSZ4_9BACT|nr:IPExxxVDY family protein [Pontibacter silvestris]MCC9136213.1 IPExxxVDY family protein [Pontibacter silvestris]
MKTLSLDVEYDYNFDLYGMVSSGKDYKLAWSLNKLLGLHLTKQQDLIYNLFDKEQLVISNYEHSSEHSVVRLFCNRALGTSTLKKPYLLPDIKEYDYLLQITGALQELCTQDFITNLLRIPLVQYIKKFDPLTLKFKENLLF